MKRNSSSLSCQLKNPSNSNEPVTCSCCARILIKQENEPRIFCGPAKRIKVEFDDVCVKKENDDNITSESCQQEEPSLNAIKPSESTFVVKQEQASRPQNTSKTISRSNYRNQTGFHGFKRNRFRPNFYHRPFRNNLQTQYRHSFNPYFPNFQRRYLPFSSNNSRVHRARRGYGRDFPHSSYKVRNIESSAMDYKLSSASFPSSTFSSTVEHNVKRSSTHRLLPSDSSNEQELLDSDDLRNVLSTRSIKENMSVEDSLSTCGSHFSSPASLRLTPTEHFRDECSSQLDEESEAGTVITDVKCPLDETAVQCVVPLKVLCFSCSQRPQPLQYNDEITILYNSCDIQLCSEETQCNQKLNLRKKQDPKDTNVHRDELVCLCTEDDQIKIIDESENDMKATKIIKETIINEAKYDAVISDVVSPNLSSIDSINCTDQDKFQDTADTEKNVITEENKYSQKEHNFKNCSDNVEGFVNIGDDISIVYEENQCPESERFDETNDKSRNKCSKQYLDTVRERDIHMKKLEVGEQINDFSKCSEFTECFIDNMRVEGLTQVVNNKSDDDIIVLCALHTSDRGHELNTERQEFLGNTLTENSRIVADNCESINSSSSLQNDKNSNEASSRKLTIVAKNLQVTVSNNRKINVQDKDILEEQKDSDSATSSDNPRLVSTDTFSSKSLTGGKDSLQHQKVNSALVSSSTGQSQQGSCIGTSVRGNENHASLTENNSLAVSVHKGAVDEVTTGVDCVTIVEMKPQNTNKPRQKQHEDLAHKGNRECLSMELLKPFACDQISNSSSEQHCKQLAISDFKSVQDNKNLKSSNKYDKVRKKLSKTDSNAVKLNEFSSNASSSLSTSNIILEDNNDNKNQSSSPVRISAAYFESNVTCNRVENDCHLVDVSVEKNKNTGTLINDNTITVQSEECVTEANDCVNTHNESEDCQQGSLSGQKESDESYSDSEILIYEDEDDIVCLN